MNVIKVFPYHWQRYDSPMNKEDTEKNMNWYLTSTNKEYVPVFMLLNELCLKNDNFRTENLNKIQELVVPKEQYVYGYKRRSYPQKRNMDRGIGDMYTCDGVLVGCCTNIMIDKERIKPLYILVINRKYIPYFYSQAFLEKPINPLIFEWWFYSDYTDNQLSRWGLEITRGLIKKYKIKTKYITSWKDTLDMPQLPKMRTMREYREFMDSKLIEWGKSQNLQSFIQVGQELDTLPF